jgi:translation initiation factor IF-1
MSKDDLAHFDGKVVDLAGGGVYRIELENGAQVSAKVCGKMKKFKIRVLLGDRVSVGISPYDITHGLILKRHRF